MIGGLFCILAFAAVLAAFARSRGAALSVVIVVGYLYGVMRARFPDGGSHFVFDAGLAGLYVGELSKPSSAEELERSRRLKNWIVALCVWPLVCLLYGPFVATQHIFIQIVGLRASIFMIPVAVIGARLSREDLSTVARTVATMNIVALAVGGFEMIFGVGAVFPENAASAVIFASHDVGEDMAYRIPSTFSSAHAFGGTMVLTIPFLVNELQRTKERRVQAVAIAGLLAAVIGIFMCAARLPVVHLAIAFTVGTLTTKPSFRTTVAFAAVAIAVAVVVSSNERFRRFETLSNTEFVQQRVTSNISKSMFDIADEYPFGAGLGSAVGTSIPFFLSDLARPSIGVESEYSRIFLEQGVVGLGLWVAFAIWTSIPSFRRRTSLTATSERLAWAVVVSAWASAFIGGGTTTSIPSTVFLMVFIGVLRARSQLSEVPDVAASTPADASTAQKRRMLQPIVQR